MKPEHIKYYLGKYQPKALTDEQGGYTGQFVAFGRLSFVHVAPPKKKKNGSELYQFSLVLPVGTDVSVIKQLMGMAAADEFGSDKWQKLAASGALKFALKPQDKLAEKYPQSFAVGGFYLDMQRSVKADAPACVDASMNPMPIGEIYSGMWALVRGRCFAYKNETSGVGLGIQSIQKVADDEKFQGGDSTDEFGVVEHAPGMEPTPLKVSNVDVPASPANSGAAGFWN